MTRWIRRAACLAALLGLGSLALALAVPSAHAAPAAPAAWEAVDDATVLATALPGVIGAPSPRRGHAWFSVSLPLGTLADEVLRVRFAGGDAVTFHVDPLTRVLTAIAPPGVKSGRVVVHTASAAYSSSAAFKVVAGADPAADFAWRDTLPQANAPRETWCTTAFNGGWGPLRATYPAAPVPPSGVDAGDWKRARLVAAAMKWRGLPYQHHHIPAFDGAACPASSNGTPPGLDCSNFTSWVLDYAFGLPVSSAIGLQASDGTAGPPVAAGDALRPGDLLFIRGSSAPGPVTHVAIYLDAGHRIDETVSTTGGVTLDGAYVRPWGNAGWWPFNSFDHARRPLDLVP